MKKVRVIAPMGATVHGPAKLGLTKKQHARRSHVLSENRKGGGYILEGGQSAQFKFGEEFSIDEISKLNRQSFEDLDAIEAADKAAAEKAAADKADAETAATEKAAAEQAAAEKAAAEKAAAEKEAAKAAANQSRGTGE